jgi:hypothetical protein
MRRLGKMTIDSTGGLTMIVENWSSTTNERRDDRAGNVFLQRRRAVQLGKRYVAIAADIALQGLLGYTSDLCQNSSLDFTSTGREEMTANSSSIISVA